MFRKKHLDEVKRVRDFFTLVQEGGMWVEGDQSQHLHKKWKMSGWREGPGDQGAGDKIKPSLISLTHTKENRRG